MTRVGAAPRGMRRRGTGVATTSRATTPGNAIIEFVFVAVMVMVPLVYLVVAVAVVQRNQLAVTQAARDAGRAFATSDTAGRRPGAGRAPRCGWRWPTRACPTTPRCASCRPAAAAGERRSTPRLAAGRGVRGLRHPAGRAAGRAVGAGRAGDHARSAATSCTSTTTGTRPMRPRRDDSGSTIPLILGFFLLAAADGRRLGRAGDAFVQQRDLQAVCDGAAAAAAASSADLDRGVSVARVRLAAVRRRGTGRRRLPGP